MLGRRIALVSIAVSAALAAAKIIIGWLAGSTAVVADGLESAGDVGASALVYLGFLLASKPADENHPYGHGRFELLSGLLVGLILVAGGGGIAYKSLENVGELHAPPEVWAIWPLMVSIVAKSVLSVLKFRIGRRIQSSAVMADAWNDTVDILSGAVALTAVVLTLHDPARFLAADHYGGFAVGLIVIFTGLRIVRETTLHLMDTMPEPELVERIRATALQVEGVDAVEKLWARRTGLQYHVDIHIEVDPEMSVRDSHEIATRARIRIKETLHWVADVLVHVEPTMNGTGPKEERTSGLDR
jgi:cation diffusion facilitator family transporter